MRLWVEYVCRLEGHDGFLGKRVSHATGNRGSGCMLRVNDRVSSTPRYLDGLMTASCGWTAVFGFEWIAV